MRPASKPRSASVAALLAFAAVAAFFIWCVRCDNVSWRFGRAQTDYYSLLVHGFLKGQLSLDAAVPREILQLADPYDPAQRPAGVALHDATLFRRKYYIYFGVVPAVLLLLPFRLMTGVDLPLPAAVLTFALLAWGFALLLLGEARRRFFPRVGPVMFALVAIAVGFASCLAIALRRSSMYELPIVSGAAWALAALWCGSRAAGGGRRISCWIAASATCWGLAIGSRPIWLLGPAVLLPLIWRRDPTTAASWRRRALAALGPLAVIGIALGWYNYARFGSPLEVGQRFILSGVYEARVEQFRLRYLPWNVFAYFFAPAEWGRYFPFFHELPIALAKPRGHVGTDVPFGLLFNVPLIWCAIATLTRPREVACRAWLGAIAWASVAPLGFLLLFYAVAARYIVDFAPVLALLGAAGALAAIDAAAMNAWRRRCVCALAAAASVASVFTVGSLSAKYLGRFRQFNPGAYREWASVTNAPTHFFEGESPAGFGPLVLRLKFPTSPATDRGEELLATGWGNECDRVRVRYPSGGRVQFGFEHAGAPVAWSETLTQTRGEHVLAISLGSLFPPETHPAFRAWPAEERSALLRHVAIELDGVRVLERYQRFYDASPATLRIGGSGTADRFSGNIVDAGRASHDFASWRALAQARAKAEKPPPHADIAPDERGTIRLRVRVTGGATGAREPLIVSGETGHADALALEYLPDARAQLVLEHWGRPTYRGPVWAIAPERAFTLEVRHPNYAAAHLRKREVGDGELVVAIDGREVWRFDPPLYPFDPEDFFVGNNPLGNTAPKFSGEIAPVAQGAR